MSTSLNPTNSFLGFLSDINKHFDGGVPKASAPVYARVIDIEHIETIDRIVLICYISWYKTGHSQEDANYTEVYVISHDDFHKWCDETDRLREEWFDASLEEHYADISYAEYLKAHNGRSDYKEYLIDKKLIPAHYDWSI